MLLKDTWLQFWMMQKFIQAMLRNLMLMQMMWDWQSSVGLTNLLPPLPQEMWANFYLKLILLIVFNCCSNKHFFFSSILTRITNIYNVYRKVIFVEKKDKLVVIFEKFWMGWIYEFSKTTEVFCFRVSVTELNGGFTTSHSLIKFRLLKLIMYTHNSMKTKHECWFIIFSLTGGIFFAH